MLEEPFHLKTSGKDIFAKETLEISIIDESESEGA